MPLTCTETAREARPEATCRAGYAPSTSLVPAGAPEPYGRPVCHAGRRDGRTRGQRPAGQLDALEHTPLAIGCCAAAIYMLAIGQTDPPPLDFVWPWAVGPLLGAALVIPAVICYWTGSGMPVASGVSGSAWTPWRCWGSWPKARCAASPPSLAEPGMHELEHVRPGQRDEVPMGSRVAFGRYTLRSPVRVCLARWPRKRRLPGLTSEFAAGHHGDVSKCDGREECPDRRDNRLAHHDQENYGTGRAAQQAEDGKDQPEGKGAECGRCAADACSRVMVILASMRFTLLCGVISAHLPALPA